MFRATVLTRRRGGVGAVILGAALAEELAREDDEPARALIPIPALTIETQGDVIDALCRLRLKCGLADNAPSSADVAAAYAKAGA